MNRVSYRFFFQLQLLFIGKVLILATPAFPVQGAERIPPPGGGGFNPFQDRLRIILFSLTTSASTRSPGAVKGTKTTFPSARPIPFPP